MGMYYGITSNAKEKIKNLPYFPNGLSYFFEQIGGYGEESMVSQVEKILNIDLSNFQNYDFDDNDSDDDCWQKIEEVEGIIEELLLKIKAKPNYFNEVKFYAGDYSQFFSMSSTEWKNSINREVNYGYPKIEDKSYLENGFIPDLNELKKILDIYKKHGADRIKLFYG